MEKSNKNKLLIVVYIFVLLTFIVGTTFAYFSVQVGKGANAKVDIKSGTTDVLVFNNEGAINIKADASNFALGMENLTQSAKVSATLTPNDTTNKATKNYNVYLIIEKNDLIYTTKEETPELIIKITDPQNKTIEKIIGLNKCQNENTDNFDITKQQGVFVISEGYEIMAENGPKTDNWNITVTLVNLKSNQNENTGKEVKGKVVITTEKYDTNFIPEINSISTDITHNSIKVTLNTTPGTNPIKEYYYAIKKESEKEKEFSYTKREEDSFDFTNLDADTDYLVSIYMIDEKNNMSSIYETKIRTGDYKLPQVDDVTSTSTLNTITVMVSASVEPSFDDDPNKIETYYYSKNGEDFVEESVNTHTFDNLQENMEYIITVKVKDTNGKESPEYTHKISTKKTNIINEFCKENDPLTSCVSKLQASGTFEQTGLVKHSTIMIGSAEDNSIRYAGSNPNNFVCFKASSQMCNFSDLYRIIGIFENENDEYEVKLIKADYATSTDLGLQKSPSTIIPSKPFEYKGKLGEIETFPWSGSNKTLNNNWSQSTLKSSLNEAYYNKLNFKDLITINKWITKGGNYREIVESSFQMAYKYEMGKFDSPTTYSAHVGLMYVSDYYYASDPSYWSLKGTEISKARYHNWMRLGLRDLTISKTTSEEGYVFTIEADGHIAETASSSYNFPVRPTFYLNKDVKYIKGIGSAEDPIYVSK